MTHKIKDLPTSVHGQLTAVARQLALVRLNTKPETALAWLNTEIKRQNINKSFRIYIINESSDILKAAHDEAEEALLKAGL
jgi:hypothetical protein